MAEKCQDIRWCNWLHYHGVGEKRYGHMHWHSPRGAHEHRKGR